MTLAKCCKFCKAKLDNSTTRAASWGDTLCLLIDPWNGCHQTYATVSYCCRSRGTRPKFAEWVSLKFTYAIVFIYCLNLSQHLLQKRKSQIGSVVPRQKVYKVFNCFLLKPQISFRFILVVISLFPVPIIVITLIPTHP